MFWTLGRLLFATALQGHPWKGLNVTAVHFLLVPTYCVDESVNKIQVFFAPHVALGSFYKALSLWWGRKRNAVIVGVMGLYNFWTCLRPIWFTFSYGISWETRLGFCPTECFEPGNKIWCCFFHSRNSQVLVSMGRNSSEPSHHYLLTHFYLWKSGLEV